MADGNNNREQMFSKIEDWKQSKVSIRSYCNSQSISYHKFHYWYKRYRSFQSGTSDHGSSSFIFIDSAQAGVGNTEIIYPDGKRVLFHGAVGAGYLKALLL